MNLGSCGLTHECGLVLFDEQFFHTGP